MGEGRIPSKITANTESIQINTKKGGDRISLLGCFSLLFETKTMRRHKTQQRSKPEHPS
jgi:hypothetical protein